MSRVPPASDHHLRQTRRAFRALHDRGCFVVPNPWDVGSARYLAQLGFQALATTSAGHAWSVGRPDGNVPLDDVLAHLRLIVDATPLPVNADFGNGMAADAAGVEAHVARALRTGVAGLSIEDSTGDASTPLFDLETAVARLKAARTAIDRDGGDTLLVGRAEGFFVGRPDLPDVICRLQAYAAAGADCLYAPGLRTLDEVAAVVAAVAPTPVNVLVSGASDWTVAGLAALGVRRISVGGAMARAAWGGFIGAARSLAEAGRFDGFQGAAAASTLNGAFADPASE